MDEFLFPCCLGILFGFFVYMLFRNQWVYEEVGRISRAVHRLNVRDIDNGVDCKWRWLAFEAGPSYNEMFFKFWRPVGSFFPPVEDWEVPE